MVQRMTAIRIGLIGCALLVAVALAILLVLQEGPTSIVYSPGATNSADDFERNIDLIFKEFHPAGNVFTGSVTVEIFPKTEDMRSYSLEIAQSAMEFKTVLLQLDHFDGSSYEYQGGTDAPINMALPPEGGPLTGNGSFSWSAVARWGPFFYPFDNYMLHVNPSLMRPTKGGSYLVDPVDILDVDFGASNLVPHLIYLKHDSSEDSGEEDSGEIVLQRPDILIALAVIVAMILVAWLLYLIFAARPEENAGNIVGLFVGVFSIRSSLLSGAPLFPSLIDYCALAVYLAAVLIVLIKYVTRDPAKTTKDCPFCVSAIPEAAVVCPHCTRRLSARSEISDQPTTHQSL